MRSRRKLKEITNTRTLIKENWGTCKQTKTPTLTEFETKRNIFQRELKQRLSPLREDTGENTMKCWKKVRTLFSSNKHPLKNSRKQKRLLERHEMSFFHVMPLHSDNGHHDPVVIITMIVIFNKNLKKQLQSGPLFVKNVGTLCIPLSVNLVCILFISSE